MKRVWLLPAGIFFLALCVGCGGGGGGGKTGAKFVGDEKEMIEFGFSAQKNPSLTADVKGVITGTSIACEVPHAADLTALVADFTSNGSKIEVDGKAQTNGVTPNNFSSALLYRVYAADGTFADYRVTVTRAPDTAKKITSFSISDADGDISEQAHTIKLLLPHGTSRTALVAVFSAIGASVTVNGVEQVSGVTANDFTTPLRYLVTADDGSTREYTVTVEVARSSEKQITSFMFRSSDNPALASDITGLIAEKTIELVLPYGSSPADLAAYFVASGISVTVNGAVQKPGLTRNNFSQPLTYRVEAEDGTTREYTVTATIAKNSARELVSFVLDGERGAIDKEAGSVSVLFPAGKSLQALTASFVVTGVAVIVNGVEQVSGTTVNDFSTPLLYTVRAEDGSERGYTVSARNMEYITGLWNFESIVEGEGYRVVGAMLAPSLEGNGLNFDGRNDYVLVRDSDALGLYDAGSIEVIFKARSLKDYAGIVHKGEKEDFSDEAYSLQFWGKDTLRMIITNDQGKQLYADSTGTIVTDTWHHVVAAWDGGFLKLYVDGTIRDTVPNTIGKLRDSAGGLVIGAQLSNKKYNTAYGNFCLDGIIDRVVVYNRSLSESEITAHYRGFFPDAGSSLTAYIPRLKKVNVIAVIVIMAMVIAAIFAVRRMGRGRAPS